MKTSLKQAANLRETLQHYEIALGITDLSAVERDTLFAFRLVQVSTGEEDLVASEDAKKHPIIMDVPHASYHRALRSLVDRGFMQKDRQGAYRITMSNKASG